MTDCAIVFGNGSTFDFIIRVRNRKMDRQLNDRVASFRAAGVQKRKQQDSRTRQHKVSELLQAGTLVTSPDASGRCRARKCEPLHSPSLLGAYDGFMGGCQWFKLFDFPVR